MKIIKIIGGEFVLEDDEAENVEKTVLVSGGKGFMKLRCGAFINITAIQVIMDIPLIAYSQGGYPLEKNGRSFIRDGVRVMVEDLDTIQYLPDPKYKNIKGYLSEKN